LWAARPETFPNLVAFGSRRHLSASISAARAVIFD
jgi:hypothetical protein